MQTQLDTAIAAAMAPSAALWVEHDKIPDLFLQRIGNSVFARYEVKPVGDHASSLQFDKRVYFHSIFDFDSLWTLKNTALISARLRVDLVLEFESLHDRTKTMGLEPASVPVEDSAAQTISLMGFTDEREHKAYVAMGHVGAREFKRALLAHTAGADFQGIEDWRYEYAVFRDDESIVFNVRPDETDAKPVTVYYLDGRVTQL